MAVAQSEAQLPSQRRKQQLLQRLLEQVLMSWQELLASLGETTIAQFHPVAFG
jgi:hypothetical protein